MGGKLRLPRIRVEEKYKNFGNLVHGSIKEYYQVISPAPHIGEIKGTIQTIIERNWKAEGIRGLERRRDRCIHNFIKFESERRAAWAQYKPTHVEQKKQATINGINYRTIADVYWEKDETIVDWKTGRMNRLDDIERVQGKVMAMVWIANGFRVRRVIFSCLFTGLKLEMPQTTVGFVESKVRTLKEYDRLGDYPKRRGPFCGFCGLQLRCELEGRCLWM